MALPIVQTTFMNACTNLGKLCDQVANKREIIIIQREDVEDVTLISARELSSLQETLHLFSSPRNAGRLLTALARAERQIQKSETS